MSLFGEGIEMLKLVDQGRNAVLWHQLGQWIDKVSELQKRNEELVTENATLREEVRFKGVLERIDGHTFVQGDDEEICSRCAEVDKRLVHLLALHSSKPPYQKATCPSCKTEMLHAIPRKR